MKLDLTVVAGTLKNRTFYSPDSPKTHPMSSKVRQAIFNMLGDISGLSILDVFAGSGALSIESISRGAESAVMVENNYLAISAIKTSIKRLKLSNQLKLMPISSEAYLKDNNGNKFDIVFADPPYDDLPSNFADLNTKIASEGLLILSVPKQNEQAIKQQFLDLKLLKQKEYGKVLILIYKK